MTTIVYVAGSKGGTGKTTTAHMACLGAILLEEPAAYVLTDPLRKVRGTGRPYGVLDGRNQDNLSQIIKGSESSLNGWLVIDGGGNRPDFDEAVAPIADLVVLPFRASEEDLDTVAQDLARIPTALAWPAAWSTNAFAQKAALYYLDALEAAFPGRLIRDPILFVNSVADLLAANLGSPSTQVRSAARKVFRTIKERSGKPDQDEGDEA